MGRSQPSFWHLSLSSVTGLLYPTGNNGGGRAGGAFSFSFFLSFFLSLSLTGAVFGGRGDALDELPALPDLTTLRGPLRGGMVDLLTLRRQEACKGQGRNTLRFMFHPRSADPFRRIQMGYIRISISSCLHFDSSLHRTSSISYTEQQHGEDVEEESDRHWCWSRRDSDGREVGLCRVRSRRLRKGVSVASFVEHEERLITCGKNEFSGGRCSLIHHDGYRFDQVRFHFSCPKHILTPFTGPISSPPPAHLPCALRRSWYHARRAHRLDQMRPKLPRAFPRRRNR
jgi:hypothetical protein